MNNMKTSAIIEALLFSKTEPWTVLEISTAINKSLEETKNALDELENELIVRGVVLIRASEYISLGTNKEASIILEKIYKEELNKSLSKASIETLSIVMYGNEITRSKIDYIRGVNSGFILRSLLMRGLIERRPYPKDRKSFMYIPTIALLASLGVTKITELPEYEKINSEIEKASLRAETLEDNSQSNL